MQVFQNGSPQLPGQGPLIRHTVFWFHKDGFMKGSKIILGIWDLSQEALSIYIPSSKFLSESSNLPVGYWWATNNHRIEQRQRVIREVALQAFMWCTTFLGSILPHLWMSLKPRDNASATPSGLPLQPSVAQKCMLNTTASGKIPIAVICAGAKKDHIIQLLHRHFSAVNSLRSADIRGFLDWLGVIRDFYWTCSEGKTFGRQCNTYW